MTHSVPVSFSTRRQPASQAWVKKVTLEQRKRNLAGAHFNVWNLTPSQVTEQALPIGEAFKKLVEVTGESPAHLTQLLYQSHHVGLTWYVFAAIGVAAAVMISQPPCWWASWNPAPC